jgi:hypothetical protein
MHYFILFHKLRAKTLHFMITKLVLINFKINYFISFKQIGIP